MAVPRRRIAPALGIHVCAALACAAWLAACASTPKPAAPPATAQAAAKPEPPPPPLPNNPVRLLPDGARAVVVAVMPDLRGTALFEMIKRWAVHAGCLDESRAAWLLERTERVVIASYPAANGAADTGAADAPALAVFRGTYTEQDVRSALAQGADWLGAGAAPIDERQRGRFHVLRAGAFSGAALSSDLLAFGRDADLDALLDVADGKRSSWLAGAAVVRGVDTEAWLSNAHTLGLITQLDERTERRVHHALANFGAGGASDGLGQSSAAFAVKLGDGAHARLQVAYPGSAAAAHAADELRSLISQASLIIRLAGLPRLDRAVVTSDGELLSITLALSADEVEELRDPLSSMLDAGGPACGQRASAEH
jgi:hypothetical protein